MLIRIAILVLAIFASGDKMFAAPTEDPPVYVLLWFDTEDYMEPTSDDAAMRLALDLESMGVRATFKVVGEKARVLEQRKRFDVIRALARHDIGYHTDFHSVQPTPAVYLDQMGWLDGAAEFRRREEPGLRDLQRIFGVVPTSYGQPGSSWAPQSHRALRQMGVPIYLDEGSHVAVRDQPYWFAGVLNVFGIQSFAFRAGLREEDKFEDFARRFDQKSEELRKRGGGLISIYYHPTEFVATEFWDGVNFLRGESRERSKWKGPRLRTKQDSERTFEVIRQLVRYVKPRAGVRFITGGDIPRIYRSALGQPVPQAEALRLLRAGIRFAEQGENALSAAELLQSALGMTPTLEVEGPLARGVTTVKAPMPRWLFEKAKREAVDEIRAHRRLPSRVWAGTETMSLADFAATLAADDGGPGEVAVRRGDLTELESYVATDGKRTFNWVIHPDGFEGRNILELARLQAWTLKPARLR